VIELVRLDGQRTAKITIPGIAPTAVRAALGGALPDVTSRLERHDVPLAGPPYARAHPRSDGTVDLEAGLPVARSFPVDGGGVEEGALPSGDALVVERIGGRPSLEDVLAACRAWLDEARRAPAGPWWERYLDDPSTTAPAEVRTTFVLPVS
jgi:hypothetical protein